MSAFHGQQTTADGIHILPRYSFATQVDMIAAAYTAADNGCCIQVGAAAPYTYYIMKDFSNSGDLALGYVAIASGTGDFVGPAGATVGNAVSFGDATGLVGADSGKAAANIPSALPVGLAEGGTGQTTAQTAMETLSPGIAQRIWVNQNYTGTGNGSINAPYTTIQGALNAIGPATSAVEEVEAWTVEVAAGFYDENLTIPDLRTITLECSTQVVLSDSALATSRSISLQALGVPAVAFPKRISFKNILMTGPIVGVSAATAPNYDFYLEGVNWVNPAYAGLCIDLTGWVAGPQMRLHLDRCRLTTSGTTLINSNTANPTADVVLSRATYCDLSNGDLQMGGYSQIDTCRFEGAHRWKLPSAIAGVTVQYPQGYLNCDWSSPGTASVEAQAAGDFLVDAASYRRSQGITFTGSAGFTAAPFSGVSNAYLSLTGGDWQVSAVNTQNMKSAIDRLATAVNGLLGGTGIP